MEQTFPSSQEFLGQIELKHISQICFNFGTWQKDRHQNFHCKLMSKTPMNSLIRPGSRLRETLGEPILPIIDRAGWSSKNLRGYEAIQGYLMEQVSELWKSGRAAAPLPPGSTSPDSKKMCRFWFRSFFLNPKSKQICSNLILACPMKRQFFDNSIHNNVSNLILFYLTPFQKHLLLLKLLFRWQICRASCIFGWAQFWRGFWWGSDKIAINKMPIPINWIQGFPNNCGLL